ncbi:VanZ like family protein [compost metagenome]
MKKLLYRCYPALINVYTVWMLYLLFFANFRVEEKLTFKIRYIPFETIYLYVFVWINDNIMESIKNILGNILLLVPYGFLGILYPRLNQFKWVFFVFFIIINIIEFSQYYFRRGFADVDDIILNTFGMTIGYIIYKKWFFIKDK